MAWPVPRPRCVHVQAKVASVHWTLALLTLFACAHAPPPRPLCPASSVEDPPRQAAIWRVLAEQPAFARSRLPRLCFAAGRGRGVLVGESALVDPQASDAELAAQLAHLAVHLADRLGDGCAQGLDAAVESEERAHLIESRLRVALSLPPAPPSAAALADYRSRCPPKTAQTAHP